MILTNGIYNLGFGHPAFKQVPATCHATSLARAELDGPGPEFDVPGPGWKHVAKIVITNRVVVTDYN